MNADYLKRNKTRKPANHEIAGSDAQREQKKVFVVSAQICEICG
jgi:hypothetical protein